MSVWVKNGTTELIVVGDGPVRAGYTLYTGEIIRGDDDLTLLMVWDTDNIRPMNASELTSKAKAKKIKALKAEGLSRIQLLYPSITDFDMLDLIGDLILSILPAARDLQPDLATVNQIKTAGKDAVIAINALADEASVNSYDVVNTPSWP